MENAIIAAIDGIVGVRIMCANFELQFRRG
jgi:hypothetical protein